MVPLVEVNYTELTPITTPQDALRGDAPLLHEDGNIMSKSTLVNGDVKTAIANAKYVVTRKYKTPHQEHAFMKPECAITVPEGDDGLLLYTGSQSVYDEQREIAMMLKIPKEKVHCHSMLVGGGFGGKEDMSVQHHAALMAWYTKKPVKVKFTRQESLAYHTKCHPTEIEITTAYDENGILTGMKAVRDANPNHTNLAMTVTEGPFFAEKALMSDQEILRPWIFLRYSPGIGSNPPKRHLFHILSLSQGGIATTSSV